jgi:lipid II:glycine glycyltransferase (peptidoglycan interpeptide bridge formation enzyme)
VQVLSLTETHSAEWNALVRQEPCFSLLQSWEWGVFKEKLGWKAFRIAVEESGCLVAGAQLLVKPLPLALSIAYVPRGPIGRWLDCGAAELLLTELSREARRQGASFLKIEPPWQTIAR